MKRNRILAGIIATMLLCVGVFCGCDKKRRDIAENSGVRGGRLSQ